MKPDEEMHAAVEEVDMDPCDLFVDLGTLIVEGRVPGLTERGFGESPHCPATYGQNRHQCNPALPDCQKYEQIQKHMLLLWRNGIPMSIEVLLYPSCCTPSQNVDSLPEMAYILLEQWTIHMLPRRVPDANISSRGLIQAVRSFLYFSQLCAWLSLTGGKSPRNVHYRVCVPGEAFSSKFSAQPDSHIFPIANIGRNAAMKVLMKCHPRCGEIPEVPCLKHSLPSPSLKASKTKVNKDPQVHNEEDYVYDGIVLPHTASRTSSPADSMLGECLLDPPNSLCMYPKRYQSPSRCGSPSIEVPEHLMFGKAASSNREEVTPPRRQSRPQRRPVVERFLKKTLGDDVPSLSSSLSGSKCQSFDKQSKELSKSRENIDCGKESALSYFCINENIKVLPREEMEEVLMRLRERHAGVKHARGDASQDLCGESTSSQNKSLPCYMNEMKIDSHELTPEKGEEQSLLHKTHHQAIDSKALFKRTLRLNKEISYSRKFGDNFDRSSDYKPSLDPISHPASNDLSLLKREADLRLKRGKINNRLSAKDTHNSQTSRYSESEQRENYYNQNLKEELNRVPKNIFPQTEYCYSDTYHKDEGSDINCQEQTRLSGVNIKKYGAILPNRTTVDELTDEREIVKSIDSNNSSCETTTLTEILNEESVFWPSTIPSAEEKAFFRRSLDSATSLVFHQRSGLPLTSSPAPIRKSGTCFDFDSSLTSVSAIKRALFEKEAEAESTEQKAANLSNSAPASVVISSSLLGTFEESVLNGRLEPVSTVEGFTAEIGASGSFCPRHITLPVTVFFYTLQDMDKVTSPYMGHINLRSKDYHVPKKGTVQVTLFNPHNTVVKMFVVRYDLSDMPVNCQTFLRQRTLYMPSDASENEEEAQKWLRYLIHLRFASSKSGRIYLHTDIRVIIFRKSDLDAATVHGQRPYELRSFTHSPINPKFSPHKP